MYTKTTGVLSDSMGQFKIIGLEKGKHKLSFSALGYDSQDTLISIENSSIIDFQWAILTRCEEFNINKAFKDIEDNKIKLLIESGDGSVINKTNKSYRRKFGVTYYDLGHASSVKRECMRVYNNVIITYLDKKQGNKWRYKLRQDVVLD